MLQQASSNFHTMRSPPGVSISIAFLFLRAKQSSCRSGCRLEGKVPGQKEIWGPSLVATFQAVRGCHFLQQLKSPAGSTGHELASPVIAPATEYIPCSCFQLENMQHNQQQLRAPSKMLLGVYKN